MLYSRISITIMALALVLPLLGALVPLAHAAPKERSQAKEISIGKERPGDEEVSGDTEVPTDPAVSEDTAVSGDEEASSDPVVSGDTEVSGGKDRPSGKERSSATDVASREERARAKEDTRAMDGDNANGQAPTSAQKDPQERPSAQETRAKEEGTNAKKDSSATERPGAKERSSQERPSDQVVSPDAGVSPEADVSPGEPVSPADEVSRGSDTYIVVLDQAPGRGRGAVVREEARAVAHEHGLGITHVYDAALAGFAAKVPNDAALRRLQRDPRVASVEPDWRLEAFADDFPLGADRVGADSVRENELPTQPMRSGASVAVLDTGIDAAHVDLAGVVQDGIDCTKPVGERAGFGVDIEGHGTHVSGTISALNNGIGVVGVAPGTPLYDVKVLGGDRIGQTSWTLCGLDWVAQNAATFGIKIVNMSLGGEAVAADHNACGTTTTALHNAVCAVTAAGVRITAAAGNSSIDANTIVPATYNEVTTVSALVDSDGCTGGKGRTLNAGRDDTRANFSNTGRDLDVAAPGARVISTAPGDLYDQRSGTSMATPHVTAAMALGWSGTEETRKGVAEGILKVSANTGC